MASTRVYIGRLPYKARERDVEDFFRGYGKIREILLKNGFGFVEFDDARDADDAVYALNGRELCGERVVVEMTKRPPKGRDMYRSSGYRSSRSARSPERRRRDRDEGYSRYGPPSQTPWRCIVQNLSSRVSWQDLKDFMRQSGEVTYADAHRITKNEGVVCFTTHSELKKAIDLLDGKTLGGRRIKLTDGSRGRSRSYSSSRSRSSRSRSSYSRSSSRSRSRSSSRRRRRSSRSPPSDRRRSSSDSASRSPSPARRKRSVSESSRSVSPERNGGGKRPKLSDDEKPEDVKRRSISVDEDDVEMDARKPPRRRSVSRSPTNSTDHLDRTRETEDSDTKERRRIPTDDEEDEEDAVAAAGDRERSVSDRSAASKDEEEDEGGRKEEVSAPPPLPPPPKEEDRKGGDEEEEEGGQPEVRDEPEKRSSRVRERRRSYSDDESDREKRRHHHKKSRSSRKDKSRKSDSKSKSKSSKSSKSKRRRHHSESSASEERGAGGGAGANGLDASSDRASPASASDVEDRKDDDQPVSAVE